MFEMIERVARALWRQDNPADEQFSLVAPNDWDAWPETGRHASLAQVDHSREDYRAQARAAIEAMREPTYPMVDAGGQAIFELNGNRTPEVEAEAQVAWPAMIDAALGKEPDAHA